MVRLKITNTLVIFTFLFQASQSFSIFFQILDVHIEMFSFVLILIESNKCVFVTKRKGIIFLSTENKHLTPILDLDRSLPLNTAGSAIHTISSQYPTVLISQPHKGVCF